MPFAPLGASTLPLLRDLDYELQRLDAIGLDSTMTYEPNAYLQWTIPNLFAMISHKRHLRTVKIVSSEAYVEPLGGDSHPFLVLRLMENEDAYLWLRLEYFPVAIETAVPYRRPDKAPVSRVRIDDLALRMLLTDAYPVPPRLPEASFSRGGRDYEESAHIRRKPDTFRTTTYLGRSFLGIFSPNHCAGT